MRTVFGWSLSLTFWAALPVCLTWWPQVNPPEIRLFYVAIWSAWGWLPATLAYTTLKSAASLRMLAHKTVDTTIPEWCASLADKSSVMLLRYLDNQTITLAQRKQQAEELILLWKPRVIQAQAWLRDPELQDLAQKALPPLWWNQLQMLINDPLSAQTLEAASQAVEQWLKELEIAVHEARTQSAQPLKDWLTVQTQTFVLSWYTTNIAPHMRTVRMAYRIWLGLLGVWALAPWIGWFLLAALL